MLVEHILTIRSVIKAKRAAARLGAAARRYLGLEMEDHFAFTPVQWFELRKVEGRRRAK